MTPDALHTITHYGYWVIFAGALLEGETVLIAAGYAAHQGLLSWPWVIVIATAGGAAGDQLAFLLGRWKGLTLLSRIPRLAQRIPVVHQMLERYQVLVILMIRFLYGLRIAGPIILGTSPIPFTHFVWLNLLGALLWATIISGVGYYFSGMIGSIGLTSSPTLRLLVSVMLVLLIGRILWLFSKKS